MPQNGDSLDSQNLARQKWKDLGEKKQLAEMPFRLFLKTLAALPDDFQEKKMQSEFCEIIKRNPTLRAEIVKLISKSCFLPLPLPEPDDDTPRKARFLLCKTLNEHIKFAATFLLLCKKDIFYLHTGLLARAALYNRQLAQMIFADNTCYLSFYQHTSPYKI